MNVDLSQGSHFFHNISSFGVSYFSVPPARAGTSTGTGWHAGRQSRSSRFVRHVRLAAPLRVEVDGRTRTRDHLEAR